MPTFQRFAEHYYLGTLDVATYDGDQPAMQEDQFERVNRELYSDEEAEVIRLDQPLVMKLDNHYLTVTGERSIPGDTLALPDEIVHDLRNTDPPEEKQVLLATPDANLNFLYDGTQLLS